MHDTVDASSEPRPVATEVVDLLGRPLAGHEHAVLDVYIGLREALRRDDLPPCAAANLRAALAPVAVAVTDLGLRFEHLVDDGV